MFVNTTITFPGCPELFVCLIPINARECLFDRLKNIVPIQGLEGHVLESHLQFHHLNQ